MTGLERNSEVVRMAAYAPLFVHANFVKWPTNLIVIDNHRSVPAGGHVLIQTRLTDHAQANHRCGGND